MIFSRKNALKDGISIITENNGIHPRKYGISLDRKVKDDKKVYFYENFIMILVLLWRLILFTLQAFSCIVFQRNKTRKLNIWD